MHVKRLLVRGFRSLREVDISLGPGVNVLVGQNNAGKSNVLRALDILLGEKWPTYQDIEDSWFFGQGSDSAESLLIGIWLEPGALGQSEELRVRCRRWPKGPDWSSPDSVAVLKELQGRWEWMEKAELEETLRNAAEVVLLFYAPRQGRRQERIFTLAVRDEFDNWQQIGVTNELRDAMLTTSLIPAFRSGADQLRITSYSWYGKLIRHLYSQRSQDQAEALHGLQREMKKITDEVFRDSTQELRSFLSEVVFYNKIRFQVGSDLEEDIHKQVMLFVDDGVETPYIEKGAGIQSALVVGLFSYYCKTFHKGSSLLLIEEPELHLHPQARRALHKRIMEFSQAPTHGGERQVILSTHAPEFVRSVDLRRIVRLYKDPVTKATGWRVVQDIGDAENMRYQQITKSSAEMFFADHVILVEGGEEYLLPPLADKLFGKAGYLDAHNIAVTRVGGKDQFPWYVRVLEDLGISWSILGDLDLLVRGLGRLHDRLPEAVQRNVQAIKDAVSRAAPNLTGKKVSSALNQANLDWVQLYREVDEAIAAVTQGGSLPSEQLERIRQLWSRLKERVERRDMLQVIEANGMTDLLHETLEQLAERGLVVHRRGDLESCLTDEALRRFDGSKDRRALALSEEIERCVSLEDVGRWICDLWAFERVVRRAAGLAKGVHRVGALL